MAGYQRHDFDTINVAPQSDGPWGALARGISNGYQIGQAINKGINRYNVAKANDTYNEGMDNLKANQTAVPVDEEGLKKLDEKFGGKTLGEADAGFKGTQYENMTASEYFRQNHKRDFDKESTALAEARDRATKDSFLHYEGAEAYNQYRRDEASANAAEYENIRTQKKMAMRKFLDTANSNSPEGFNAILSMGKKLGVSLPQGVQVDTKNGTFTMVGPNGKPQTQPLTAQVVQPYLNEIKMKMFEDIYVDDMKQLEAAQNYRFSQDTYKDRVQGVKLGNAKTKSEINMNGAKTNYYRVSANEMQKNGDVGRGLKVGTFIGGGFAGGFAGGKGNKDQDVTPMGKWDKSGSYVIDGVPYITHTEQGAAVPRLDGTGYYTPEETGELIDGLKAAGYTVQTINDGGELIPVIKTLRGPVPLSHAESLLAHNARVASSPRQAVPTTSVPNYNGKNTN